MLTIKQLDKLYEEGLKVAKEKLKNKPEEVYKAYAVWHAYGFVFVLTWFPMFILYKLLGSPALIAIIMLLDITLVTVLSIYDSKRLAGRIWPW